MSAKYTRLGQLKGKFVVPAREYLTARDFAGNFTYEIRSTCLSIVEEIVKIVNGRDVSFRMFIVWKLKTFEYIRRNRQYIVHEINNCKNSDFQIVY